MGSPDGHKWGGEEGSKEMQKGARWMRPKKAVRAHGSGSESWINCSSRGKKEFERRKTKRINRDCNLAGPRS
ncbi:hypothetical protein BHM03_00006906 [Ensete ventricosum]|nr:hypothetical protein BHM03_00006906 [Ensete ventricosum]